MARCKGTKGDGSPCERIVTERDTFCYAHDPAHAEERKKTAAKAGRVRRPLTEIHTIKARIRELAEGVVEGKVDKGRASIAFQGYGVLVRWAELERRHRELDEIAARLDELEAEHERRNGPGPGGASYTTGGGLGW